MSDRLLSVHDVSDLTGWSPLTIYKKSAAGEIPGRTKLGKHSLRFRESEVKEWLGSPHPNSMKGEGKTRENSKTEGVGAHDKSS